MRDYYLEKAQSEDGWKEAKDTQRGARDVSKSKFLKTEF